MKERWEDEAERNTTEGTDNGDLKSVVWDGVSCGNSISLPHEYTCHLQIYPDPDIE
jgi:hypothetical protein